MNIFLIFATIFKKHVYILRYYYNKIIDLKTNNITYL